MSYASVPLNNGPAYAQPSGAPMDENRVLEKMSSNKAGCTWSATGEFLCEGLNSPNNGINGRIATPSMMFEGFSSSAKAGNLRKGQEGFCDCGIDPYPLN